MKNNYTLSRLQYNKYDEVISTKELEKKNYKSDRG